jgi:N6-L-threonylcarbamoyladenine synthase
MMIFAIESSCDETAAALVKDGRELISGVVSSQIKIHARYAGVVPELASRAHIENINTVIQDTLKRGRINFKDFNKKVSLIAYTRGPGLAGSLLVGQVAAQTLSAVSGVPAVGINHIEGHLYACLIENKNLKPPYLALIVSGGHTELIIVKDYGNYKYLGGTRDDAAGEAFDKTAKLLDLPYPGGPVIDKLAKRGDQFRVKFTRPFLWGTWDFSFSGIKTAVVNEVKKNANIRKEDICASFQAAVVETLVLKTIAAAKKYGLKNIVVGGGVAANSQLRKDISEAAVREGMKAYLPSLWLCTDNASMIGCAGYYKFKKLGSVAYDEDGKIDPGLKLKNWK